MFNVKKPLIFKKKLKQRRNTYFKLSYSNHNLISILAYRSINLLYYNLTFLNFILSKKRTRKKKMSRKERFKRNAAQTKLVALKINKTELNKFGNKNIFKYLNVKDRKNIKVHFLKKNSYFKKKFYTLCLPLVPYTKKTVGLRMGKGKGSVKNFQYRLRAGMFILLFKGWNLFLLTKFVKMLKKKLPNAFKINLPNFKSISYVNSSILWNY